VKRGLVPPVRLEREIAGGIDESVREITSGGKTRRREGPVRGR
jgi:hypothetical protein